MGLDSSPTAEVLADPDGGRQKGSSGGARPPPRQACVECRRRVPFPPPELTDFVENKVRLSLVCMWDLLCYRCNGFGKSGCKTCKVAGVDCVFPESQKRGSIPFESGLLTVDRTRDTLKA